MILLAPFLISCYIIIISNESTILQLIVLFITLIIAMGATQ